MVGDKFFTIHPRRGTIAIFDKLIKYPYSKGFGIIPKKNAPESKGGGCFQTTEGNLQVGPSATETPDKEDDACYPSDLEYGLERGYDTIDGLDPSGIITYFTGVRAPDYKEDFIIGMSKKVAGFINVAAIQSPGLVSAPAVAEMVEDIILDDYRQNDRRVEKNPVYNPILPKKVEFRKLSHAQRDELIKKDPKHGHIICRCETITEGEILDAVRSKIVPISVDAIKRRTRAGMGRCQGGFCQQKVVEILARELGKEWVEITLKGKGSYIVDSCNRQDSQTAPLEQVGKGGVS
jgi:glycerol-3-phosphate dehydrogenase